MEGIDFTELLDDLKELLVLKGRVEALIAYVRKERYSIDKNDVLGILGVELIVSDTEE